MLFISLEMLQIHGHSNAINFLLNYSSRLGTRLTCNEAGDTLQPRMETGSTEIIQKMKSRFVLMPIYQHHNQFTPIDNVLIQKGAGMFSPRQLPHQRAFPNCLLPLESPSSDRQVILPILEFLCCLFLYFFNIPFPLFSFLILTFMY